MFKKIFSSILTILIVSAGLHVDTHHKLFFDGNYVSNFDNKEDEHSHLSDHCEKCLVKNNNIIVKTYFESNFSFKSNFLQPSNSRHADYSQFTCSLFSRPPPNDIG
tara:strand:- start:1050 stop:1367 length:318 start_codon:yes stop_codon:yes gene_type:complete